MSIKESFKEIITEINSETGSISSEVIENTPERMEIFYKEIFSGLNIHPEDFLKRTFPVPQNDLVLEKEITFYSMCEHHFLPFFGKIAIGYIPNGKIVGFGDLVKVIEAYAKRPQLQERMCGEIADTIFNSLKCQGVYVLMEAEHLCMTMRGVKAPGSKIVTTASRGIFSQDNKLKTEIINLIK